MDTQQNIVHYDSANNINYYVTNLFHQNKFYKDDQLHLLLYDISSSIWHKSSILNDKYYYNNSDTYLFWNNNPLHTFVVAGTVISYHWKHFNSNEYIIFNIDDNSFNSLHCNNSVIPQFVINKNALSSHFINNLPSIKNIHCKVSNPNFKFNTLDIVQIIDFNFNLIDQINFWHRSINDKHRLENSIWNVESHNNNNNQPQHVFIESLNNNIIKNNLEILSPYLHPQDTSASTDLPPTQDIPMIEINTKDTSQIAIDTSQIAIDTPQIAIKTAIETATQTAIETATQQDISLKCLHLNFLSTIYKFHQLMPRATNITITDLYQFNGLTHLLDQYTKSKTSSTISASVLKSNIFNDIISHYQHIGLISTYNNNNNCNISPFLQLLSFIQLKCTKWIKLQSKINTINLHQIIQTFKPTIENLNVDTVLKLYKIVMNDLKSTGQKLIQDWYVELDSNGSDHKYALIHITFM